jgi:hypothetical protein
VWHHLNTCKLKVNESKSAVARPQERKFPGFSFTYGPEIKRTIAPKSLVRFKRRVREITRRAKGVSIDATMEELVPYSGAGAATSVSAKLLVSSRHLLAGSSRDSVWPSGDNGKQPVDAGQLSWHWASVQNWLGTQPAAVAVPDASPTPRPYPSRFPRPISNRSVSRIWRM